MGDVISRKDILVIGIVLMVGILVSGCSYQNTKFSDKYDLNSLIITFNEKSQQDLVANINDSNNEFREFLQREIDFLNKNTEDYNITIGYLSFRNKVGIKIDYYSKVSMNEKEKYLLEIKKIFENKWYVNSVYFSEKFHTT